MNEAAAILGAVFTVCMMGVGLVLVVKVAREGLDLSPRSEPLWPRHPG